MRIAIQLYGQTRQFNDPYRTLKKCILDHFDHDVYVTTWDDSGADKYIKLVKPKSFQLIKPCSETYDTAGISRIDAKHKNNISIHYDTRYLFNRLHNTLCGLYLKKLCNELILSSNINYDVIIMSRNDLVFGEILNTAYVELAQQYLMVPIGWNWESGLNDLFAMASPAISKIFCSEFDYYEQYVDNGTPSHPEHILRHHVLYHRLPIHRFSFSSFLRQWKAS